MSTRTISVYDSRNLFKVLSTVETTIDPSTLIPFYDEDSAVLFLFGKVCIANDIAFNPLFRVQAHLESFLTLANNMITYKNDIDTNYKMNNNYQD